MGLLKPNQKEEKSSINHENQAILGIGSKLLSGLDNNESDLLEILFPNVKISLKELLLKYPPRYLPEGANVTRISPSPTGYMHIGTLYTGMINERIAHESKNGVFYLRIEDTDSKRYVKNSEKMISDIFCSYGIKIDEGNLGGNEFGQYGPYHQSERKFIYDVFIKDLLEKGLAYPCFCSQEELMAILEKQKERKLPLGYYGERAKWRSSPIEDVLREYKKGTPYVIRFKSYGNLERNLVIDDILKGNIEMPENNLDIVLQKADGLPTYHFAHVVDDHLMGTTMVIRGNEWLPSTPLHHQLFSTMSWTPPKYGHLSPIQKIDNGVKRKLSKRKDPETTMMFYDEQGYPKESILDYLMNLANSNFENWRKENPHLDVIKFPFSIKGLSSHTGGAIFDFKKLESISKETISKYSADEMYNMTLLRAQRYDHGFYDILLGNRDYAINIFNIDRDSHNMRKDISKWSEIKEYIGFFFDEIYVPIEDYKMIFPDTDKDELKFILYSYLNDFNSLDSQEVWFDKFKKMSLDCGYADNVKLYKKNPDKYKGSIADVSTIIRFSLTGKNRGLSLYDISRILGLEKIKNRFSNFIGDLL